MRWLGTICLRIPDKDSSRLPSGPSKALMSMVAAGLFWVLFGGAVRASPVPQPVSLAPGFNRVIGTARQPLQTVSTVFLRSRGPGKQLQTPTGTGSLDSAAPAFPIYKVSYLSIPSIVWIVA